MENIRAIDAVCFRPNHARHTSRSHSTYSVSQSVQCSFSIKLHPKQKRNDGLINAFQGKVTTQLICVEKCFSMLMPSVFDTVGWAAVRASGL